MTSYRPQTLRSYACTAIADSQRTSVLSRAAGSQRLTLARVYSWGSRFAGQIGGNLVRTPSPHTCGIEAAMAQLEVMICNVCCCVSTCGLGTCKLVLPCAA